jgi:hypothetical protein
MNEFLRKHHEPNPAEEMSFDINITFEQLQGKPGIRVEAHRLAGGDEQPANEQLRAAATSTFILNTPDGPITCFEISPPSDAGDQPTSTRYFLALPGRLPRVLCERAKALISGNRVKQLYQKFLFLMLPYQMTTAALYASGKPISVEPKSLTHFLQTEPSASSETTTRQNPLNLVVIGVGAQYMKGSPQAGLSVGGERESQPGAGFVVGLPTSTRTDSPMPELIYLNEITWVHGKNGFASFRGDPEKLSGFIGAPFIAESDLGSAVGVITSVSPRRGDDGMIAIEITKLPNVNPLQS